jgi:uncharacterized protein
LSAKQTREIIWAFGHKNIQAVHPTTLMLTKEKHLKQTGDCIIAVAADKAVADLSAEFKDKLRKLTAKLTILIEADDLKEQIKAYSSPMLTLSHSTDIVVRRSDYICNRTLAIRADKASNNLPRALIEKMKDPEQEIKITLIIES